MTTIYVNKAVSKVIKERTILAAFTSAGTGAPSTAMDLQEDLVALKRLENSPLVDAAVSLVTATLLYCTNNTKGTKETANKAREVFADMLINTKEVK